MPEATGTALSDADYHRLSAAVLAALEADADRWLQQDVIDIDTVSYTHLTLPTSDLV